MVKRKVLLKGMLAALALAAVAGVLALFTPGTDLAWRVAGSAIAASIACGLMMPMSIMAEKAATRAAGLLGMWICVIEFVLGTGLVWSSSFGSSVSESIALVALMLALCGLVAVALLRALNAEGWRVTAIAGSIGMAAAFCVLAMASVSEGVHLFSSRADMLWPTGWCVAIAALLAAFCLVGVSRRDRQPWRWVGVAGTIAGLAVSIWGILNNTNGDPVWVLGPDLAALCVAHAIVCRQLSFKGWQRGVQITAIIATVATSGMVVAAAHFEHTDGRSEEFTRFAVAMGIIAGSATMALPVFKRMNRKIDIELRPAANIKNITLVCPRCEKKQVIPVGGAMCAGCKLYVKVEVRMSSCATCGYDLSNLGSDRCPECGAVVSGAVKTE